MKTGATKLYERINHEMEEETQHADALMRRILMLEGTPTCALTIWKWAPPCPRCSRPTSLEYKVRAALCKGIELCELHKDYISRDILRAQLE
jgi:bacterioferritin